MKFTYKPKNNLEKFGRKVYDLLVENFSQTYYVGGLVRDSLLGLAITDVDLATEAKPKEVIDILEKNGVSYEAGAKAFGVIKALSGKQSVEIATFRKDSPGKGRFPKVKFITSPKEDSKRRDFTINSLYLKPKSANILDFHDGLKDLKRKQIKFIGLPNKRIKEDPLRIIRAIRFALLLKFNLEKGTLTSMLDYFYLINLLSKKKIHFEVLKLKNKKLKRKLKSILKNKNSLTHI